MVHGSGLLAASVGVNTDFVMTVVRVAGLVILSVLTLYIWAQARKGDIAHAAKVVGVILIGTIPIGLVALGLYMTLGTSVIEQVTTGGAGGAGPQPTVTVTVRP